MPGVSVTGAIVSTHQSPSKLAESTSVLAGLVVALARRTPPDHSPTWVSVPRSHTPSPSIVNGLETLKVQPTVLPATLPQGPQSAKVPPVFRSRTRAALACCRGATAMAIRKATVFHLLV